MTTRWMAANQADCMPAHTDPRLERFFSPIKPPAALPNVLVSLYNTDLKLKQNDL
jgi:hypothetical protein